MKKTPISFTFILKNLVKNTFRLILLKKKEKYNNKSNNRSKLELFKEKIKYNNKKRC